MEVLAVANLQNPSRPRHNPNTSAETRAAVAEHGHRLTRAWRPAFRRVLGDAAGEENLVRYTFTTRRGYLVGNMLARSIADTCSDRVPARVPRSRRHGVAASPPGFGARHRHRRSGSTECDRWRIRRGVPHTSEAVRSAIHQASHQVVAHAVTRGPTMPKGRPFAWAASDAKWTSVQSRRLKSKRTAVTISLQS